MKSLRQISNRLISDNNYITQAIGALLSSWWNIAPAAAALAVTGYFFHAIARWCYDGKFTSPEGIAHKVVCIAVATVVFVVVWRCISKMNRIFSLRRQETRITINQVIVLATFGLWIAFVIFALGIKQNGNGFLIVSIAGSVLGWIFQDTIKSVAAFFYLRANGLLQIGDWIEVKSNGINGIVRSITLTTVLVENWDTTTSAFPTYILQASHFHNNQRMLEGKTHGRLMSRTFYIDTEWIHPVSADEAQRIRTLIDADECFKDAVIRPGESNAAMLRRYVYHWLMNNVHVCQMPRLFVTWKEPTAEGLPLHVYAFITDTKWDAFEWQQAAITEHIIGALAAFNLQLYQSPSGYDASNSNIHLSGSKADYRKETELL